MGTEYNAHKQFNGHELNIDEMSERFSLTHFDPNDPAHLLDGPVLIMRDLTPEDLYKIGLQFLQTASYFTEEGITGGFRTKVTDDLDKMGVL